MDNVWERKSERGVYAASSPEAKVGMDFHAFLLAGGEAG
jgi:hypothetical protein